MFVIHSVDSVNYYVNTSRAMCWSDEQVGHQSEGRAWDPNAKINTQKSPPGHRIIVKPKHEFLLALCPTVSEQNGGEPGRTMS